MSKRAELEQRIEATRREIDRLEKLPETGRTWGNPSKRDAIRRKERSLAILIEQRDNLEIVEHDNISLD